MIMTLNDIFHFLKTELASKRISWSRSYNARKTIEML